MICMSKPAFEKMFLRSGADKEMVEKEIAKKLLNLKSYPSQDVINEEFQDLGDIVQGFFTLDSSGHLQRITDVNTMTDGQAIWAATQIMTFPAYYYDDQFFHQQIKAAGLELDKIENYTILKRGGLLTTTPTLRLSWIRQLRISHLLLCSYHLSKPVK